MSAARAIVTAAHFASYAALAFFTFRLHEEFLFLRWDGHRHLNAAVNQYAWPGPGGVFNLDFLKANGELAFGYLYPLDPAFGIAAWLSGGSILPWLIYGIAAICYFAAVAALGTALGFRRPAVLLAAWAGPLLFLPFFVPPLTFIRQWGNPIFLTGFAVLYGALALWCGIRGADWRADAARGIGVLLAVAYVAAIQPVTAVIGLPVVMLQGAALAFFAEPAARRARLRMMLVLALPLAWAVLFPLEFHAGTKNTLFMADMIELPVSLRHASFFIYIHGEGSPLGAGIYAAAIAATAWHALRASGMLRIAACTHLLAVGAILAVALVMGLGGRAWRPPPLAYLDLAMMPFHFLFLASAVAALIAQAAARWPSPGSRAWFALGLAGAALPWFAAGHALAQRDRIDPNWKWPWPMAETALVRTLAAETALAPDAVFRGRVVNIGGSEGPYPAPFLNQHGVDGRQIQVHGNDHRNLGFWYYNIPTLNTAGQFTTPFFHAVITRLLNPPGSSSIRSHDVAVLFRPGILQALGVRYVLSDAALPPPAQPRGMMGDGDTRIRLFELDAPNTGNYSPVSVVTATTIRAALEHMSEEDFDARRTAVLFDAIDAHGLVPAVSRGLITMRDGVRVEAASAGRSLLVLPVEYSSCADIRVDGGPGRVLRANVNQTAILFEGTVRVTVQLHFGMFANRGCRFADLLEARRLGMAEVAGWWPRP